MKNPAAESSAKPPSKSTSNGKAAATNAAGRTPRVLRFEDLKRGAPLVPVAARRPSPADSVTPAAAHDVRKATPKPRSSPPKAASTTNAKDPSPTRATDKPTPKDDAPDLKVQRLPPLDRTAPRWKVVLPPGLPQRPIELYPETGSR
ncbi:MAG: hypothetical protein HYX69_17070 [Planctomycetia bacterium]|nr:hypothetical protein [Planctomycetia bacterium]